MTSIDSSSDLAGHLPTAPVSMRAVPSAISGVLAAATSLAVGHLVAGLLAPAASPLLAVGSTLVDLAPQPVKAIAIDTFGENDKAALLIAISLVLVVIAAAIGLVASRRLAVGVGAVAGVGAIGAVAALARPVAVPTDALPSLFGAAIGVLVLVLLIAPERLGRVGRVLLDPGLADAPRPERRRFLVAAGAAVGLTLVAGGLGAILASARRTAIGRIAVPVATDPAPVLPAGAALKIPGIAPFYTPNADFYRVDTALDVPVVDPATWRLRVHGMVDREIDLTFDDLLQLPTIERDITLTCVSNQVGGGYVGTARWIGVPLRTILDMAGVRPGADQIVSRSVDGMTIGTPTAVALDGRDAMLALAMNGEPLPAVHGFPVRMLVPGLYGYVSATKWLVDIELTTFAAYDPYWVQRGWAPRGPIKTMARIDTPRPLTPAAAGAVMVGGVAWAQHRGVERVEVRIDEGDWHEATLSKVDTVDTWRQWTFAWTATPGRHLIEARATDGTGMIQTGDRAEPFPDGATGWHSILVPVA